ncbi:MAG TPA: hypothetical protein VLA52_17740 [Thermohalobaculum sp.]|nr:hypothetical protein [Thermohalobaculum sp.]
MRIEPDTAAPAPLLRFLTSLERWVRGWLVCIAAALVLAVAGLMPTVFSVVAMLAVLWLPIVVLTLWGRMLDEMMHPRSDMEDGCR